MRDQNEKEVFQKASESKAYCNDIIEQTDDQEVEDRVREIKAHLEIIERRADPERV